MQERASFPGIEIGATRCQDLTSRERRGGLFSHIPHLAAGASGLLDAPDGW